jgi:hypothetical protein
LIISHNLIFNSGSRTDAGILIGGGILVSAESGSGTHDYTTVSNNIVRNNSGQSITEWDSVGSHNVYFNNLLYSNGMPYSLRGGGPSPTGTLTSDPQMVSFNVNGGGNYHLLSTSPAINAGTTACGPSSSSCTPTVDYDGFARPYGGALDVGPYEWHP